MFFWGLIFWPNTWCFTGWVQVALALVRTSPAKSSMQVMDSKTMQSDLTAPTNDVSWDALKTPYLIQKLHGLCGISHPSLDPSLNNADAIGRWRAIHTVHRQPWRIGQLNWKTHNFWAVSTLNKSATKKLRDSQVPWSSRDDPEERDPGLVLEKISHGRVDTCIPLYTCIYIYIYCTCTCIYYTVSYVYIYIKIM